MKKNYVAKLKQFGVIVAKVESQSKERTEQEINHYNMVYSQDGETKIIRNYKR